MNKIITELFGPDGNFKLLIDDPDIAGLPVIGFAGPVAEGFEEVTPDLPKELMLNDSMLLFVETSGERVTVPHGWTNVGKSLYANVTLNDSQARYLSVFYRRAVGVEASPTVFAPNDHIMAQVVACRPQASTHDGKTICSKHF